MGNLIECPMCGKMISPNAEACPNCGEPMKKKVDNSMNENNCTLLLESVGQNSIKIIKRIREVNGAGLKEAKDTIDNVPSVILKNINLIKANGVKESFEDLGAIMKIVSGNENEYEVGSSHVASSVEIKNQIKCPNCNSIKVNKISGLSKVGSAALFGIFSIGKLTKTYECRQCGYRW